MPGVIMENGIRHASHTNHDRDPRPNGLNGGGYAVEKVQDKGKGRAGPQGSMTPISPTLSNGMNGGPLSTSQPEDEYRIPDEMQARIDQLPPEIAHITHGYMDLKMLVYRLAQKTHSDLLALVKKLAQMPSPPVTIPKGLGIHVPLLDDNHPEGLNKKIAWLKGIEEIHTSWVKALVILGWSRRAEDVSKMIDLKIFLDQQNQLFTTCVETMAFDKRGLYNARLPNPDLRTALEIMGTGKASWMPDLGYLQPPPLTAREVLNTFEKLNTLLSIRLNLTDYDKVPVHFKDFTIQDGRATFKVAGEFEVDLAITEEDSNAQFWFIDIRFQFWPSLDLLTPRLRNFIDGKMNEILREQGLGGCYQALHEMILTYKINEFRRQAIVLSTSLWSSTLKVEYLHRAISIQYWSDRFDSAAARTNVKSPKSWIIMGVHSGKSKDAHPDHPDPKATSRLFLRWFRDSKEVKDVEVPYDDVNISTETLLRTVITKHTNFVLTSIYEKLSAKPLYKKRDLDLHLETSETDGSKSVLKIQLTSKHRLSISIEPINGRFIFGPPCRRFAEFEAGINSNLVDPATSAHDSIERLRNILIYDGITTSGRTLGWNWGRNPGVKQDQLVGYPKDAQKYWFRRPAWISNWYLILVVDMSGERWELVQTAMTSFPSQPNIMVLAKRIPVPIQGVSPVPTYRFLAKFSIFAAAMISYHENLKALWSLKKEYLLVRSRKIRDLTLPSIHIHMTDLLEERRNASGLPTTEWAKDLIKLTFHGVENELKPKALASLPHQEGNQTPQTKEESAVMITEARMTFPPLKALANMSEKVDHDIAFHPPTGSFAFRLRSKIGEPVIRELIEKVIRVERVVDFVKVLERFSDDLTCETVSLSQIVFTYLNTQSSNADAAVDGSRFRVTVDLSARDSSVRLLLEKNNPQLRIVDHLTNVLNATNGLRGVAQLLPLTLPVLRGLEAVENSWTGPLTELGEVFVNVRALDWYIIRYQLSQADPPRTKKIIFEIRMKDRRGELWWHIKRADTQSKRREQDALDELLKAVWTDQGTAGSWIGMRVSGVAKIEGVEELLERISDVVQKFALSDEAFAAPLPVAPIANMAPQRPQGGTLQQPRPGQMHMQMQRQQATPNSSQSQGHTNSQGSMAGRGNPLKRTHDVINID